MRKTYALCADCVYFGHRSLQEEYDDLHHCQMNWGLRLIASSEVSMPRSSSTVYRYHDSLACELFEETP